VIDSSYLAIFIIIIAVAIALYIIRQWFNRLESQTRNSDELVSWLKELGRQVQTSTSSVDQKLARNMEMFNNRLDKAAYVIADVQKSIGEFSEIGRSMKDLQEFLQSPKLRGNIGEHILKELLAQYLPQASYVLQFSFKSGEKVDAIIKTSQGVIPIDSKFPLENFRRLMEATTDEERIQMRKEFGKDVKKHIQDIARKYILAGEGTVDYALMYIPSEVIYYEIINNADLYDYAGTRRVLPVSPLSFYAYMRAILMSFEGQKIQSQAKEIITILAAIKKDYEKADEAMSILNKHITNAYNQTSQVSKVFTSLGQKLNSTNLLSREIEEEKLLE
jgi:DNA recombination protein RmuC